MVDRIQGKVTLYYNVTWHVALGEPAVKGGRALNKSRFGLEDGQRYCIGGRR